LFTAAARRGTIKCRDLKYRFWALGKFPSAGNLAAVFAAFKRIDDPHLERFQEKAQATHLTTKWPP
jgi:hypothetical protein